MTGEREEPGSNDEFNVGGHGTARVRRRGLADERSRLSVSKMASAGYGTRRRPHIGSDDDPGQVDAVHSVRLRRSEDTRIGHRGRSPAGGRNGTSGMRLVSRGANYPRGLSDGLAEHFAGYQRVRHRVVAVVIGRVANVWAVGALVARV